MMQEESLYKHPEHAGQDQVQMYGRYQLTQPVLKYSLI